MFTKEQLIEALSFFTAKSIDIVGNSTDAVKAAALSNHVRSMTSVCSTGKREVAALLTILTRLNITATSVPTAYTMYSVRKNSTSASMVIVDRNRVSYFDSKSSSITNMAWVRSTVPASKEDIVQFCNEVYKGIESYELTKAFVKMLESAVKSYLETTKEK